MTLLKVFLAAVDSDEVVIFKLVDATVEVREVHARDLDLAAHQIDCIEDLSVGDKFFFAFVLEDPG